MKLCCGLGMNIFSSSQPLSMNIGFLRITTYSRVAKFIKDNKLSRAITDIRESIEEDEKSETRRLYVRIEYERYMEEAKDE